MTPDELDLTPDEELEVLALIIDRYRNTTERLPTPWFYARELLAIRDEERRCIATGQWVLTPLSEVLS